MADLDVERKNKDNDNNNNNNRKNNRDRTNQDNSKKWWVGAIIAVVLIIILLLVLNDRTDLSMDDEPVTEPTALVEMDINAGTQLQEISELPGEIKFL